jgi:hypothetical protein
VKGCRPRPLGGLCWPECEAIGSDCVSGVNRSDRSFRCKELVRCAGAVTSLGPVEHRYGLREKIPTLLDFGYVREVHEQPPIAVLKHPPGRAWKLRSSSRRLKLVWPIRVVTRATQKTDPACERKRKTCASSTGRREARFASVIGVRRFSITAQLTMCRSAHRAVRTKFSASRRPGTLTRLIAPT